MGGKAKEPQKDRHLWDNSFRVQYTLLTVFLDNLINQKVR